MTQHRLCHAANLPAHARPSGAPLDIMKRILRYLRGTPDFGLLLRRSSSSDLVVYTDTDWASCLDTRRSMLSYVVFLGDNLVS
jgi:hypothetical protein